MGRSMLSHHDRDPATQGHRARRTAYGAAGSHSECWLEAIFNILLRIQFVEHPRKGNRLPNVVQAADPGHRPLDSHAEAGVGD